ncbi:DUF4430 domain-containing protein [bacterium]|nr:MAG: DUF4430 domain-containing protein [bacterium]
MELFSGSSSWRQRLVWRWRPVRLVLSPGLKHLLTIPKLLFQLSLAIRRLPQHLPPQLNHPIKVYPGQSLVTQAVPIPQSNSRRHRHPQPIVNLQLKSPAGSSQYIVKLMAITDACTILIAARDQGYVKSVTIDNSYLSTLKSAYVREINGYYNNWTFKVNGASPKGCSLASITTGDTVVWEYQ